MIEFRPLSRQTLADLPAPCDRCAFWESNPVGEASRTANSVDIKKDWIDLVTQEWGTPGWVAYMDGDAVGYVAYAPAHLVPRQQAFPTGPVSADAILLTTVMVVNDEMRHSVARRLIEVAAKDALWHKVRAIEAFGAKGPQKQGNRCLQRASTLESLGFHIVREHPTTPRLRLDIRTLVTWRDDLAHAAIRVIGALRPHREPLPESRIANREPTS